MTYNNVQYLKNNVFILHVKACQNIILHQTHKIMIFKKASNDPFNCIINKKKTFLLFYFLCF